MIDDKYLDENNIIVKLSDFGSCCNVDLQFFDIQTRYYRAPEILLNYPYNENKEESNMCYGRSNVPDPVVYVERGVLDSKVAQWAEGWTLGENRYL